MSKTAARLLRNIGLRAGTAILSRLQTPGADPMDLYSCYQLLLQRKPDPQAWRFWLPALKGLSRQELVDSFLSSAEYLSQRKHIWIQLEGYEMYFDPRDPHIGRAIAVKSYEPHIFNLLKGTLAGQQVFLDIGANMGWFTLLAAACLPKGKVIAFEPNHNDVQMLYRSLDRNGFRHVSVFPFAVTDENKVLRYVGVQSNGVIIGAGAHDNAAFVQGVRLDDILKDEQRIDVVKMDIEGHEPRALQGMRGLLEKHRPLLITEFHPKAIAIGAGSDQAPADYLQQLINLGYALSVLDNDGQETPCTGTNAVFDCWRKWNARLGAGGSAHLDLVCRAKSASSHS